MNPDEDQFTVIVQRDRFKFEMQITKSSDNAYESYTFELGKTKPCLKLYVRIPKTDDERYIDASTVASLLNIEALLECTLDDINENYIRKHGFAHELLATVDYIIKTYFPHVKCITLNDSSYLPCNRAYNDTLDLLIYSIALYGKTWYEIKCNAYINDSAKYKIYKEEIKRYTSEEFKASYDADMFLLKLSPNDFARNELKTRYSEFKEMFVNAKTFPEFFQAVRNTIPPAQKCRFFKHWLEQFIDENISIHRTWQYDVAHSNILAGTQKRVQKTKQRMTRRK